MACDVAAKRIESLGKRSLDHADVRHHAVPLGDAGAAWSVHADGMHQICLAQPAARTPSIIELWLGASDRIRQSESNLAIVAIPVWLDT
jgi:hypothetical protein